MDMFDDDATGNTPEFTVSELSGAVRRAIEGEFGHVRVRGEVGRVMVARTGHMYFDLKDQRDVIACVSWKGQVARFAHRPEEGMEVIATGRMTTFGPQSKYQLNVEAVEPAGAGALMAMLEKRKKALEAEGLFAAERKRPLPYLPEVIGVVTSPTGAVIRDILHRLRDRFPRKVLIWPVAVQGERCAAQVAAAIEGFNAMSPGGALPRPDLLIVARGGGSIEDLWGFNEEIVARAAAASDIPLISAVGHETDTTLIDYVSDRRAPTPTAAAEMAVPVRMELLAWLDGQGARLSRALSSGLTQRGQRLRDLARALPRADTLLDRPRQRLDLASDRLPAALTRAVHARRLALSEASGRLHPSTLRGAVAARRDRFGMWQGRLSPGLLRAVADKRRELDRRADRLGTAPIRREIAQGRRDLDRLALRFDAAAQRQMSGWAERLAGLDRLRETLGYRETLARGYAVVHSDAGLVTSKAAAQDATGLELEFADGRMKIGGGPGPKRAPKPKPPEQGSLF